MLIIEEYKNACSFEAYEALKKGKLFGDTILKSFGFLVKEHSYMITLEGLSRGWAFVFNRDNISIFLCHSIEHELPLVWVEYNTSTHQAQKSIEEIADLIGFEGHKFKYEKSSEIEKLNFFRKLLFRKKYKNLLLQEYDRKIEDSGNFILNNYNQFIELVESFPNLEPITSKKLFR